MPSLAEERCDPRRRGPTEDILEQVLATELASIRLLESLAPRPRLEDLFSFYGATGFLHPGKLAGQEPRRPTAEATWHKLLRASDDVFKLVVRRVADDGGAGVRNAACAYLYAPGTWQAQHIVGGTPYDQTGTLAVLSELVQRCHDGRAAPPALLPRRRLGYEPPHRRSRRHAALGPRDGLRPRLRRRTVVCAQAPSRGPRTVRVRRVSPASACLAERYYARVLHPAEAASLRLHDPGLDALAPVYRRNGLFRTRSVFLAFDRDEIVGGAMVNHSSEGVNFCFLENAIDHVSVEPGVPTAARRNVWNSLVRAAAFDAATRGRTHVVATTDPCDRDHAVACGLLTGRANQSAVLTLDRRENGFLRAVEAWKTHSRIRLDTPAVEAAV